ncbi:hypothetical protein [Brevundimonas sp.]|jgi:hypothetical protein|uniref:hypothetical protein n=1 Tax=Brevundimonas sp. TaxID=1871086 RepID=UPI0037BFD79A
MAATRKITVEVPEETAREIDAKVASGFSESPEAYLLSQNPRVEDWLRNEVVPTLDRIERENTPGVSAEEVLALVKARRPSRFHGE